MGDVQPQSALRRQSAASALLAQLLGNHSQPSAATPDPSADHPSDQGAHRPQLNDFDRLEDGSGFGEGTADDVAGLENPLGGGPVDQRNPTPAQTEDVPPDDAKPDASFEDSLSHPDPRLSTPVRSTDLADGLTDPLLFAKSGLDHSDLFPPFDVTAAPKTPFEALQQNEMLTAAYLSQNADLSALGYSGGLSQDMGGDGSGSEPRIQAFAKLEFDDGHFYCNTYSFVLGRDVRAARAAHQREFQARQVMRPSRPKSSSGGHTSHTPGRAKHDGSGMIGSVVSDRGGIMGFDPDVPPNLSRMSRRCSSNSSHGESAPPLHANPAQLHTTTTAPHTTSTTTDYNALAMQSLTDGLGDAKPVDTLALLPSPDSCPTIPIHPPTTVDGTAAGHRGISRKHVKIAYNFDKCLFEMEVMGRNGAFIGADWLSPGQIRPLHSGDYIQIGGVRIRFLLPDVPIGETGAERADDALGADEDKAASTLAVETEGDGIKDPNQAKSLVKSKDADPGRLVQSIEPSDPSQPPARRRGPGRPPKDGIMSKRERAELAREQKLAAKREANGGVTPPPVPAPAQRPKAGKTTTTTTTMTTTATTPGATSATPGATATAMSVPPAGPLKESVGPELSPGSKPEKRKYTKRKKPDGTTMDIPFPTTEGGGFAMEPRPEEFIKAPPVKKRKPSRSPSPNYPPESAYGPEDLAKPPYNYAVLIFDALTEAGTPMTLKQIYRALKLKYPYFRFKCETEGWTSSVRHNLNGNGHLFMHAERDGKGWSWQLRPGASVEKEKKRRPSPPPPSSSQPPSAPSSTPQYMPPLNPSYGTPANGPPAPMANPHFQFPQMPSHPYPAPSPAPPAPSPALPAPSPVPPQASPYPPAPPLPPPAAPPQATAPTPFPIPSPIRNNLPPAFAQTTPSTYTSPYASDPPPQLVQLQQQQQLRPPQPPQPRPPQVMAQPPAPPQPQPQPQPQQPSHPPSHPPQHQQPHPQQHQPQHPPQQHPPQHPPQHQSPYPPPPMPSMAPVPHQHPPPQQVAPNQAPPVHHQHTPQPGPPPPPPPPQPHQQQQQQQQPAAHAQQPYNVGPSEPGPGPMNHGDMPSFNERANKAIDDFEVILMEDYEDKNYIREVLKSARARALGDATESSFPGGEPKDEAVIVDALRNLIGSLKGE